MGFTPISIEEFIKMHLESNPAENEKDLLKNLKSALADYNDGVKCSCGNDIWVNGSAFTDHSCFTCITGESPASTNYEIDLALKKNENKKGRRHIDTMDINQIHGFFDDDGYEINTEFIKKPSICLICVNDDNSDEDILCQMTRNDQKDEKEFKCFAFKKR